ncbi:MAG: c-type cytochrome [Deltaproteobacteria bacterium]|nr:c-type cytochrome [Deltaproteobacteria bacterium]
MIRAFIIFALLFFFAPGVAFAVSGDPAAGKEIYAKRCWWCHGKDGAGDGPAAEFLSPPPRDFTLGLYKWKTTPFDEMAPGDQDLYKMISGYSHDSMPGWNGMNDTSMPGWSDVLSDKEIWDLAAYLKGLSGLEPPEKPTIGIKPQKASKESIERGRDTFKDRCAECHGEEGMGDGIKKLKDDWGARTWPRNLTKGWTYRAGSSAGDIYTRITVGIPGTQMPSFADPQSKKKLSDGERWDVANYVASLNAAYKKPGDESFIRAAKVEGRLPEEANDSLWDKAEFTSFYLVPQLIADERQFRPTLNSLSVKALYNENEIAFLVEWDDATRSAPGDEKSIELADGEVFRDGVAIEFPATTGKENEKPYFGMGDSRPVVIWHWQSEEGAGLSQSSKVIRARGFKNLEEAAPAVPARGRYEKGRWRVIFKRPLRPSDENDIGFEEGRFIPVAFAAWDGSNGDRGGKHAMTGWHSVILERKAGSKAYAWVAGAVVAVFLLELLWLKSARRD